MKLFSAKVIFPVMYGSAIVGALLYGGFMYWQGTGIISTDLETPEIPYTGYVVPVPNTHVTWNGNPTELSNLHLILGYRDDYYPETDNTPEDIHYYQMGSHGGNTVILATAPPVDPSGLALFFFEKTPDGKYISIAKISSYLIYGNGNSQGYTLAKEVSSTDTNTYYFDILGPSSFNWNGLAFEQPYLFPSQLFKVYFDQVKTKGAITFKKVGTLPEGELYSYTRKIDEQINTDHPPVSFYLHRYVLKLPSGLFTFYYTNNGFFTSDSMAHITWSDGSENATTYSQQAGMAGCGDPAAYVTSVTDISADLVVAGKIKNGEPVYQFKDPKNTVSQIFYDYSRGELFNYQIQDYVPLSFEAWAADHPLFLYKNSLGEYEIFTNSKYTLGEGCGKPVIYLYPEKPMNVSVKVGADIQVSEPEYKNGWQVYAKPDGTLTNSDGNNYESLFWEGIGHGDYPSVTKGFIVRQSELENALASQLKELGLNQKESADFLEFWLPKIPTTPYVRLTWFTTAELNELAPLVIWPRPETTIRVFLDFQGLKNKISLPQQELTSLPRKGFTVVEWGGLLRK